MGYEQGQIIGLYDLVYEKQDKIKKILSDFFLLEDNDITIRLRSSDLSVIIYANILHARKDKSFSLLTVNRLDEYVYNFEDVSILDDFKRTIVNNNRLLTIRKLIKKGGRC